MPNPNESITAQTSGAIMRRTSLLRWKLDGVRGRVLQQGWECQETGAIEWRDVPTEE